METRLSTEWMNRAACKFQPARLMFPVNKVMSDRGKKICAGCPVQLQCADYAIALLDSGVTIAGLWGGIHVSELRNRPKPGVQYTYIVCESDGCDNLVPKRAQNSGPPQRFCSETCRRRTNKARDYQKAKAKKLLKEASLDGISSVVLD
jgi:Transcription factor WhiB